jgi:hypothetical protein
MALRVVLWRQPPAYHPLVTSSILLGPLDALLLQRGGPPTWQPGELEGGIARLIAGLAVAFLVYRLVRRAPWPRPFRLRFAALHVVGAPLAALTWVAVATPLEWLVSRGGSDNRGFDRVVEMMIIGMILYVVVAGLSYAADGAARAARAEAIAARTQLAALRAQLQPHFLFNALHTVVQLIHVDPRRASDAAELLAGLLRSTLDEQRDEVTVDEEWRFVSRYLAIEQIRFGERLSVRAELPEYVLDERVPSFALQTLVENAVHHGAAPRVAATEIVVSARNAGAALALSVRNTGDGARPELPRGAGTGLQRLRERLAVLYGGAATLVCGPTDDGGFEAVLTVPRRGERRS